MKKSILITLTVISSLLSFVSCKKKDVAPAASTERLIYVTTPSATGTYTVRIQVTSTLSTSDGKFDGQIQIVTDTVNNTVLFNRYFNAPFGGSTGSFDTTFVVTNPYVNINTLLYTMKHVGGVNYDIDYAADTYMTIWVNNEKRIYLKNAVIAESVYVK